MLSFDPQGRRDQPATTYAERLAAAESAFEVCEGFVEHVRQRPANGAEAVLLNDVLADAAATLVSA